MQIINSARRNHQFHTVDKHEVDQYQKQLLGRFYKKSLPYGLKATSLNQVMFGNMLDIEPKASSVDECKTLLTIVEEDIGKTTDHWVVALIGRSGSGKTATVVDLAKHHFVVYVACSEPNSFTVHGFRDQNFVILAQDVEGLSKRLSVPKSFEDVLANDKNLKNLIAERVKLEFLSRLLFLQLLFENNKSLTPEQFFREQMNGAVPTIKGVVEVLHAYDPKTIDSMLNFVQIKLVTFIGKRGLIIAIDEAHIAEEFILAGKLIAPTAAIKSKIIDSEITDPQSRLNRNIRRGFLTPLCATLSNHIRATLVVLGTSLSLANADHVQTAIAKQEYFLRIVDFPLVTESLVEELLKRTLNLENCDIKSAKRQKLSGRARFATSVIVHLSDPANITSSKQEVLDRAMDRAIEQSKEGVRGKIRGILDSYKMNSSVIHLLCRMVLAYKLQHGRISFARDDEADFVKSALCSLHKDHDDYHWVMDEPLVVEVVEEELRRSGKIDPSTFVYLSQLDGLITLLGPDSPTRGLAFEPLVRRSLQRFNGYQLTALPFLKGVKLPAWCDKFKFQIDEINTARGFGFQARGEEADLEFLVGRSPNKMLVEHDQTRQDGAWFFSNEYAGSLAIKFCTSPLKRQLHDSNNASSDIRLSFMNKSGTTPNMNIFDIWERFQASGIPYQLKGILRIHLVFPSVEHGTPLSYVKFGKIKKKNTYLNNIRKPVQTVEIVETSQQMATLEDVMIYIDCKNMDDFFYEDIDEGREDMRTLKKIIKYVSSEKTI